MIYELIESYKLSLYEELKKYNILGYGSTATVFVNKGKPEFVIKEIYLESEALKSRKLKELSNNIFINEDEELRKMAPEFIGFDLCNNRMLLKFKYTGVSLEESLSKFNTEKLIEITETVKDYIKIFNKKGLIHGDLHLGNIFIFKGKVYIGDWGKTLEKKLNISKDDLYEVFYPSLLRGIYMAYFFKQNTMASIKKYLNSKGLYKKAIDYTVNEINWQKKTLSYKPKDFIDKTYPKLLKKYLEMILFYETFPYVKEHTKLPEDLYDFVDYLTSL